MFIWLILYSFVNKVASVENESKIYYGGKTNMLNQPEFHDLDKIRKLMELMDKKSQVISLFHQLKQGITNSNRFRKQSY